MGPIKTELRPETKGACLFHILEDRNAALLIQPVYQRRRENHALLNPADNHSI